MIFVAGGTGRLGKILVQSFTEKGNAVRVFSRHCDRVESSVGLIESIVGDVRDPRVVEKAVSGADVVVSAVQGFSGKGGTNPESVDWQGNRNLIKAARLNGVKHFVLLSVVGASPNHPIELFRMKYLAEEELKKSRDLDWTIIRSTAFMETWTELIAAPLLKSGKTRIFGNGENPINFISVYDVAQYVELALRKKEMLNTTVEAGGPENLALFQIVENFEKVTEKVGTKSTVSLRTMRFLSFFMAAFNPTLARQIRMAICMDSKDLRFDPSETVKRYPEIVLTKFVDTVRRDYGKSRGDLQIQGGYQQV